MKNFKSHFQTSFYCVYDDDSKRLVCRKKKKNSASCSNITYLTLASLCTHFPNEPELKDGVPYAISPSLLSRISWSAGRDIEEAPRNATHTLSQSPCASSKINSKACFLLWLQMTSVCVLPDFCSSQKKPIKKTNSCGPSMSGRSAPPQQTGKPKMQPTVENLSMEEMEGYSFFLQWVSCVIHPHACKT